MRIRTYGKKTRLIPRSEIAFVLDSSPPETGSTSEKKVLSEISENIASTASKTRKTEANGKSHKSKKEESPTETENVSVIARRSPRKHGATRSVVKKVIAAPEPEDLISAIEDLIIGDKYPCEKRLPQPKAKTAHIRQHAANTTAEVESYLSPLLRCKNVGSCVEGFQSWADERTSMLEIQKIGEGSFGEVYRARGQETVILKLMPLNAKKGKGSRSYTNVESATNELQLLERMQRVPGFVEFRGACVLQGTMASQFVSLWNDYREAGRTVESKDPNKRHTYPPTQLWLLIEMSDAGRNLNAGQYLPPGQPKPIKGEAYLSIHRTWDIFWQMVKSVAKAEVYAEFEHRDLHLGNICVKDRCCSTSSPLSPNPAGLSTRAYSPSQPLGINKSGVQVTLIDYTLSRATFGDGHVFFYDFQTDKNLLNGQGDLQYDMYRSMAEAVGDRSCRDFVPRTNVVWLWFVLHLMLSVTMEPRGKAAAEKEGVETAGMKMMHILTALDKSIDPKRMGRWAVGCSGDVLDMGIEAGWFLPEDVVDD